MHEHINCRVSEFRHRPDAHQHVSSAGRNLPRDWAADTAKRQSRPRLGVLQMSEIGDKANFWFAVIVIVTLLTDSIEGLL